MSFLPMNKKEMQERGWEQCDIVLVTGDAYVDHPSFGTAIISRVLENKGFKVGILSQPKPNEYTEFGRPRLGFFVNSGNIDSMVAHYTAAKKPRSQDAYTAGGKAGARPDRAVIVYCKGIREVYGDDMPIAIGGLEASLRRFAHYDYWDDAVRPSILLDSTADLLMYGMGEKQAVEIAQRLDRGEDIKKMQDISGTVFAVETKDYAPRPCAECPSFEVVSEATDSGKKQYAISTRIQQDEHDAVSGKTVIQRHGGKIVVANPPMAPLCTEEFDAVYELPYERNYHPSYEAAGGVPGIEEVKFSIIHNRGCFGACNFCSLAYHQGRAVTTRSIESVVREAEKIAAMPDFKGYIHDVGGPTANFRKPSCEGQLKNGLCKGGKKCLAPTVCSACKPDHSEYVELLRRVREVKGIKKVFIRSGVRFDYMIADPDETFFKELVMNHISGQLKVAPEHCCNGVLDAMGKPHFEAYKKFAKRFNELTRAANKEQYLVPYMISSHPGSTLNDAIELALYLKKENMRPEQVQDFYPTPGTISTAMFYTELNPYTLEKIFVSRKSSAKAKQRALLQYFRKENAAVVRAALREAGRSELIGKGKNCLVDGAPTSPNDPRFKRSIANKSAGAKRGYKSGGASPKSVESRHSGAEKKTYGGAASHGGTEKKTYGGAASH
ncbi:MAG: YgiQ family radical SAM protein, partial [Oscillospiraceae bacterium]